MIEILTLFLGLTTGLQPVDLRLADAVSRVEIHLNGEPVTVLKAPPWSFDLDLGEDLAPHRLTAIALDAEGRELDRAQRLINVADAAYDPIPNGGGGVGFSRGRELTPVAVEWEGRGKPEAAEMAGWFWVDGAPVEVVAVEEDLAEVVVVRDPAAQPWLEILARFFFAQQKGGQMPEEFDVASLGLDQESFSREANKHFREATSLLQMRTIWDSWNQFMQIEDEAELRFLSPLAAPPSAVEGKKHIFNVSIPYEASTEGVLYHATRVRPLEFELRIADAVALAGYEVHAARNRRAVLVLLTDDPTGRSRFDPEGVRNYLDALGVPLFVWSFKTPMASWNATDIYTEERPGRAVSVSEGNAMLARARKAFAELRRRLARQQIVYLAGKHLPQDIRLSPQATGLRLAGNKGATTQGEEGR